MAKVVATIASSLGVGKDSPVLATVGQGSQMLTDTVRQFAVAARCLKIHIICFYEEKETDIGQISDLSHSNYSRSQNL
jgi:hypothetical protein